MMYSQEVVYQSSTAQLLSNLGNCVFDYRRYYLRYINHSGDDRSNLNDKGLNSVEVPD